MLCNLYYNDKNYQGNLAILPIVGGKMFYEPELHFVCDTLRRCGIQVGFTNAEGLPERYWNMGPYSLFTDKASFDATARQTMIQLRENTVYQLTDGFFCRYLYFSLPAPDKDSVVTVGPYLTQPVTQERLMEITEELGVSAQRAQQLLKYYYGLPLIGQGSHLFVMLDTLFERMWGVQGYTLEMLGRQIIKEKPFWKEDQPENAQSRMQRMEMMQTRYAMENTLMDAISHGQYHKVEVLFSQFSLHNFEKRLSDSLRNIKNYCIISNTLFRKAAEKGGVHPYYLDEASSEFANRIEQLGSETEVAALMTEMAKAYCRLVRKQNMRNYSALVQKAVVYIEGDLAGNLSLRVLAQDLNVNASYLSALFKKETGRTVTDYILQRRMELAAQLLRDTRLQVQTVAQHCGIVDIHYFTKLFKRHTGLTPREFRQS